MAYYSGTYSSTALAYLTDGFPVFMRNYAEEAQSIRWCHGSVFTTLNVSTLWQPEEHLIDGRPWTHSAPSRNGTGATYSVFMRTHASYDDFDTAGFIAREPLVSTGSPTFTVSVANDSSGVPGTWTVVGTTTLTNGDTRAANGINTSSTVFYHYFDVDWVRLSWTDLDQAPVIGQVFFGPRLLPFVRQNRPYDATPVGTIRSPLQTYGRGIYNYTREYGFADFDLTFTLKHSSAGKGGGAGSMDFAKAIWTASNYGASPMYYWDHFYDNRNRFQACLIANQPTFNTEEFTLGGTTISLRELPPYEAAE